MLGYRLLQSRAASLPCGKDSLFGILVRLGSSEPTTIGYQLCDVDVGVSPAVCCVDVWQLTPSCEITWS
jgi:hypothetical protein